MPTSKEESASGTGANGDASDCVMSCPAGVALFDGVWQSRKSMWQCLPRAHQFAHYSHTRRVLKEAEFDLVVLCTANSNSVRLA